MKKEADEEVSGNSSRRNFLKKVGIGVGAASLTGVAGSAIIAANSGSAVSGKRVRLLTTDGQLVEVDVENIKPVKELVAEAKEEARIGYQAGGSYDYIHVGQTIGTAGFEGSLDVIAHEFSHGVMYRARGVDGTSYNYEETGALCESFSDIFGIMIEYFTTGTTDYIVGSNLLDYFKRSVQNPRSYQS